MMRNMSVSIINRKFNRFFTQSFVRREGVSTYLSSCVLGQFSQYKLYQGNQGFILEDLWMFFDCPVLGEKVIIFNFSVFGSSVCPPYKAENPNLQK